MTLERSWLVQRLLKPRATEHPVFGKDNPFAFGGGYRNGGLSPEAMDLLRSIWRFDYMGAAEFEFGAVPAALARMATGELVATTLGVPLAEVPRNWRDKTKTEPVGEAELFILCAAGTEAEVKERVGEWARTEHPKMKEPPGLTRALRPVEEWDTEVCGWLELDNGFAFFTDWEMWKNARRLFRSRPSPAGGRMTTTSLLTGLEGA